MGVGIGLSIVFFIYIFICFVIPFGIAAAKKWGDFLDRWSNR